MVDISDPNASRHIQTTTKVINELGVEGTDSLLVFNKIDKLADLEILQMEIQKNPGAITISSKNGNGLNDLRNAIVSCYENKLSPFRVNIDYKHARLISQIRKHVIIVDTDYEETFIRLHLRLPPGGKEKVHKILKQANQPIAIRRELG